MKIIAFSGSPRKEGLTARLLSEVLRGARGRGAETELVHLADSPLRFCMGCYSDEAGDCTIKNCTRGELEDAMAGFFQKIIWADALVIGTPVYWFSVSGLTKTFVDRLTPLENQEKFLDGKPCGLVAAFEEQGAISALAPLAAGLSWMGCLIPPYGLVYGSEMDEETAEDARRLGKSLAWLAGRRGDYNFYHGEDMQ